MIIKLTEEQKMFLSHSMELEKTYFTKCGNALDSSKKLGIAESCIDALQKDIKADLIEKMEAVKVYPRGTESYTNVDVAYNRGLDKSEKLIKEF